MEHGFCGQNGFSQIFKTILKIRVNLSNLCHPRSIKNVESVGKLMYNQIN